MNPWAAVLRALPITFLVYVSSTVLSAAQALPTGLELEGLPSLAAPQPIARIMAIESLLDLGPVLRAQALSIAFAALGYALLSPWLQMSWFAALSTLQAPGAALRAGARLMPRAYATSVWVGLGTFLLLLPFAISAWVIRGWLESRTNVRIQDLVTLLVLLPCALVLFVGCAWHDLARAHCLQTGALRSSTRGLIDALSPPMLAHYAFWSGLGLTISLGAQALSMANGARGGLSMWLWLALVQVAALLRSILRSRWLTATLQRADAQASGKQARRRSP